MLAKPPTLRLAAAAKAWAQSKKTPVIGFLGASSAGTAASVLLPAFRRGLEELGFVEGQNVVVDYVWADSLYDRLPPLAAELVRPRVDVIVAARGSMAALVAKAATSSIPIIALAGDDPVRLGLAASINRRGGNVTGIVQLVVASEGKRLEILRELVPNAKVVAFLANPGLGLSSCTASAARLLKAEITQIAGLRASSLRRACLRPQTDENALLATAGIFGSELLGAKITEDCDFPRGVRLGDFGQLIKSQTHNTDSEPAAICTRK